MRTWIIVILLILWLLGYFGPDLFSALPGGGNVVGVLLAIAIVLIILTLAPRIAALPNRSLSRRRSGWPTRGSDSWSVSSPTLWRRLNERETV